MDRFLVPNSGLPFVLVSCMKNIQNTVKQFTNLFTSEFLGGFPQTWICEQTLLLSSFSTICVRVIVPSFRLQYLPDKNSSAESSREMLLYFDAVKSKSTGHASYRQHETFYLASRVLNFGFIKFLFCTATIFSNSGVLYRNNQYKHIR